MEIYPEMSNDKISIWKRIFIFLFDFITAAIISLTLLYSIGNPVLTNISKSDISQMNVIVTDVCESFSYPTEIESIYGLVQINQDAYMEQKISENMNEEQAYEEYQKAYDKLNEELQKNEVYCSAYKSFYVKYSLTEILCVFTSLLLFQLIIPFLNPKKQTLGMLLFKATYVDQNNVILSNSKITLRFFMIFIVEFLTVYLLLSIIGEIFLVLITLATISLTKDKSTFHDLLIKSKLVPINNVYSE